MDKNAIAILVTTLNGPLRLGYIGVAFLPMMHDAINKYEIQRVKVPAVKMHYLHNISKQVWVAGVVITKFGPWLKKDPSNKYMNDIKCQIAKLR